MNARAGVGGLTAVAVLLLVACTPTDVPAEVTSPQVTTSTDSDTAFVVERTDFAMDYLLEGLTELGSDIVLAPRPNYVLVPVVESGSQVEVGTRVADVVVAPRVLEALDKAAAGSRIDAATRERLLAGEKALVAPVSGVLEWDGGTAKVKAPGVDVVVDLTPIQELRYESVDFEGTATVETVVGSRQVGCTALTLTPASTAIDEAPIPQATLRCRLPGGIETTAGLRAQVSLASATINDVLVVPNEYLAFDPESDGFVVWRQEDQGHEVVPVDVGPSDGVRRIIAGGLEAGSRLLVPRNDGG